MTTIDELVEMAWALGETGDEAAFRIALDTYGEEWWAAAKAKWVSVLHYLPESGTTVLACYRNSLGNWRRVRAMWIAAKSHESDSEGEIGLYDEASDTYFDPEGWYEKVDNWPDYGYVAVCEGAVTHWMPLPPPPETIAALEIAREEKA